MRSLSIGLLSGLFNVLAIGAGLHAETPDTRVASMPFAECLSIIADVSREVDEKPITLVSTGDLMTVRINASDGFVTVSCSRPDSRMTLSKSPVPAAAGMTASHQ